MDLKELLDKLSADFAIPLRPTERGHELQGSTYYAEYFFLGTAYRFRYTDKTASFDIVNGPPISYIMGNAAEFKDVPQGVMGIYYTLAAHYIQGQFELLRNTNTKLGNALLAAFAGAEKEPLEGILETPGKPPTKVFTRNHIRTIIIPDEKEIMPFIRQHIMFP